VALEDMVPVYNWEGVWWRYFPKKTHIWVLSSEIPGVYKMTVD
jgi:hypothetical protein